MSKIRVLCVDDSALMRRLLTSILEQDPEIEVVGTAPDPLAARDRIKKLNPDVITLDVEMPKMDGITFLERLMRLRPMPVVMVSTLTAKGAEVALRAMELGAVDVVGKPRDDLTRALPELSEELVSKVKTAAKARVRGGTSTAERAKAKPSVIRSAGASPGVGTGPTVIAIGASTGGTEATRAVLERFPPSSPPVVIAQHIPPSFSGPYAARLNEASSLTVTEGQDGMVLQPGHAYVAPGDFHMTVVRGSPSFVLKISQTERVNRHRPSVDVLFDSVAKLVGRQAKAVLLTGMGDDGARGLRKLYDTGASTVVQDEATSVVWGMPGSAVRMGATENILPLDQIAGWVFEA